MRRALLRAGTALASLLILECGVTLLAALQNKTPFPRAAIRERLFGFPGPGPGPEHAPHPAWPTDRLHPYLGFVNDPAVDGWGNEQGFSGAVLPPQDAEKRFSVVLTGGSVALRLHEHQAELLRIIRKAFSPGDRKVELSYWALGGFKQPQQLMTLSLMLALGARPDVVLALDGFNEVALPYAENLPRRVPVEFPREWDLHTARAVGLRSAIRLGRLSLLAERRHGLRMLFRQAPFRWSSTALFAWDNLDRILQASQQRIEGEFQDRTADRSAGAPEKERVLEDSVRLWKESSLQMARLCAANGIAYRQFLQPNQYHEGSKPLSRKEVRIMSAKDRWTADVRLAVRAAYPQLVAQGSALRKQGVAFHDLTQIFRAEHRTLYVDNCCHLNRQGNRLLIDAMGRALTDGAP